jgi:hypothetical protein
MYTETSDRRERAPFQLIASPQFRVEVQATACVIAPAEAIDDFRKYHS